MGKKTNLKRNIVVYVLGLIITICLITFLERKLVHLYFNHEVIIGEVTGRKYPVGKRISVTVFYNVNYNGEIIKQKSTGLGAHSFNIGGPITLLYNPDANTSYARQHMTDMIIVYLFIIFIGGPIIALTIVEIIEKNLIIT